MFQLHGISIKTLSPFRYSLDYPHLNMTKLEKNRMIQADIIILENIRAWISPTTFLGMKIAYYKALYSHSSQDGLIIRPYMDTHLSHALHGGIGQIKTF